MIWVVFRLAVAQVLARKFQTGPLGHFKRDHPKWKGGQYPPLPLGNYPLTFIP
jgi:hypothetical protein